MKKPLAAFAFPVILLLLTVWIAPASLLPAATAVTSTPLSSLEPDDTVVIHDNSQKIDEKTPLAPEAHAIVEHAMELRGTPYIYAGIDPEGFDCSGFITHVFGKFDISLPHSSAMQAEEGIYVSRAEARKGDLVIFTGTNSAVREPGHVGLVISEPGEAIAFVHASSNGGVKVSQVEGTGYDTRFLEVRRIL